MLPLETVIMAPVNKISFSATWTAPINSLNRQNRPLSQKVYDFIKSFIFFIPNSLIEPLVRWCVLPSSSPFMAKRIRNDDLIFKQAVQNVNANAKSLHTTSELEITTTDKIKLQGHFLKHKEHDTHPNARVIILFHGNGDFYQTLSYNWLPELLKESDTPYSFLLFNPRGVGINRQGTANTSNLLIDAESVYQMATNKLNISEDRIDLYGHSLGGAQAANLKKLHPNTGGRLFLDRTFSSLDKMVSFIFRNSFSPIRNYAQKLVKQYGWEFDNYKALTHIQDKVHIFTHLQDSVIPTDCSLRKVVENLNPHPSAIKTHDFSYSGSIEQRPHMDHLTSCRKENGSEAQTKQLLLDCFNTQEAAAQAQAI